VDPLKYNPGYDTVERNAGTTDRPFSFLDSTLGVLCVDDEPVILELLNEFLSPIKLYRIYTASNAREAMQQLAGNKVHACIMDLGVRDVDNDEYALLRKFSGKTCFIVLTGSQFPSKGFDCYRLGAKAVIEKTHAFDDLTMVKMVDKFALMNVINPSYTEHDDETSVISTEVLFKSSPDSVNKWAQEMGITDRQLRKIWKAESGSNAKHVLFIYHLYKEAFAYYEYNLDHPDSPRSIPDNLEEYKKLVEYFYCNKSTLIGLL